MLTPSFFTEKKPQNMANPKICTKSKKLVARSFGTDNQFYFTEKSLQDSSFRY